MKTHCILSIALLGLIITSCNNEDLIPINPNTNEQNEIIVVQERDPKLPSKSINYPIVIGDGEQTRATNENGSIIGNSDELLGHSYSVGNSIIGDIINVRHPILNLNSVKQYSPTAVSSYAINHFDSDSFSYTNYNSYESKLSQTNKIATGFSLNLGLFKIGRKKTTESTFRSEITSSNKAVYGELNMVYYNSSFILNTANRKYYARECLSADFQKSLYASTIGDVLNSFGEFVLTGYITGGKAFSLFAGVSNDSSTSTSDESNMDDAIDASMSWKDNSASASCSFGNGNGSSTSETLGFSSLQTKLWIYGGTPAGLTAMNSASNLDDVSINLDPWVESLSDSNTHTIVDIADNGLYPLSEFVLEENFKRRIDGTALGSLPHYPSFVTPYIEVVRVFERYSSTNGNALYDIAAVLTTRQGDKIVLRTGDAASATDAELSSNENASIFTQKATAIAQAKQEYYDLEIRINPSVRLNPIMGTPLCIDLGKVDEGSMLVHSNPRTGIHYIYDKVNKVAFSHLVDVYDEDWILDEYGIRDWVESLETKSISLATIANSYKIIGL